MNNEARKALDKCIEHWTNNCVLVAKNVGNRAYESEDDTGVFTVGGELYTYGPSHCELCSIYYGKHSTRCDGCPIKIDMDEPGCTGTPYELIENYIDEVHEDDNGDYYISITPAFVIMNEDELDYLKSLVQEK